MKDHINNEKRKDLKSKIRSCDPFVANTLAQYYEELLNRKESALNAMERGVKYSIEKFCDQTDVVQERELNGVIDAVNSVLEKDDTAEWTEHETAFLDKLEQIVFVKLNRSDQINELDQIDNYVESLLKLDYPKRLPTFKLGNNKRNIFNYFSLSLESISEKFKESTISSKAVNNMMHYLPNSTVVVTDGDWNIRFVGSTNSAHFDKDPILMIDECLPDYIVNFETLLVEIESKAPIVNFPVTIKSNLYSENLVNSLISIVPSDTITNENGEQDEIEEYVIKIDKKMAIAEVKPITKKAVSRDDLISIMNMSLPSLDQEEDNAEWQILNTCLEQLLELKSKKENLLTDEQANYLGGIITKKERIDLNDMVRSIAEDLQSFPGFEEVSLVFKNRKTTPFIGYYDMIYSVLRHVITIAVKFRKTTQDVNEISILIEDLDEKTSIRVEDSGIGLPEVWLTKIFDEEFLLSNEKDRKTMTNGLYFVKKTVERMNGQIELYSAPNEGSTFTILLP